MRKFVRMSVLVCLVCLVLLCVSASAENKYGAFTYELKGNGTAVITHFDWDIQGNKDVYVPNMIEGYTVTEIGEYAFSSPDEMLSGPIAAYSRFTKEMIGQSVVIILPDTVTVIDDKAFFHTAITAINIPASVNLIGSGAFAGCFNLTQHSVDTNNPTYATIDGILYNKAQKELISYPAGRKHTPETKIVIPEGIISLGDYSFMGIKLRTERNNRDEHILELPSTIKRIGNYAFYCADLSVNKNGKALKAFDFSTVTEIGEYAFSDAECGALHFNDLEKVGDYAFYKASFCAFIETSGRLSESPVTLPASVRKIGIGVFKQASVKGGIDLSETQLTEIPNYTFAGIFCNGQAIPVSLPKTLETIGESSFEGFNRLGNSYFCTEILIPASVISIESSAFYEAGVILHFEEDSCLETIGDNAFCYAYLDQEELILPDSVKSIGEMAFNGYGLQTLLIPDSVNNIGANVINRSVTKIKVSSGTYGYIYASENGYGIINADGEDTSWLNS